MDYFLSSSSVDAVRWYWLVDKLHQAAERRESFHISSDRTSIVVSDSVKAFVNPTSLLTMGLLTLSLVGQGLERR